MYGEQGRARGEPGRGEWRGGEQREDERSFGERIKEGFRKITGKGPKGYRRSDERIREDVSERIARSGIEAADVEVRVESGEVTLLGYVIYREDKRRLEDLAEDVFGVEEVHNQLRMRREAETAGQTTGTGQTTAGQIGTGQPQRPGQPGATQQPGIRH
jgi:hypothetical protein